MRLKDKIAIVTGGGKGIGAAISAAYVAEGAKLLIADVDMKAAKETAARLGKTGKVEVTETDISDPASVKAMAKAAMDSFGRVDVLVNNAGARIIKGLMQHSLDDWNKMISINLTGPFLCAQAVIPHMLKQGGGRIINLASIASFRGRPNRVAYVAAKTGVLGLTRALAADLSGKNILVNAIAPGMIASPFNKSFADADDTGPAWAQENLVGRWGQPEDLAGAAVFLASEESSFMNGSEIKIEGGWLAARSRSGEQPIWD